MLFTVSSGNHNLNFQRSIHKFFKKQAVFVCLVAAAAASDDHVVSYDLEHHEHTQKGEPGIAVTGSYS